MEIKEIVEMAEEGGDYLYKFLIYTGELNKLALNIEDTKNSEFENLYTDITNLCNQLSDITKLLVAYVRAGVISDELKKDVELVAQIKTFNERYEILRDNWDKTFEPEV